MEEQSEISERKTWKMQYIYISTNLDFVKVTRWFYYLIICKYEVIYSLNNVIELKDMKFFSVGYVMKGMDCKLGFGV